MLGNYSNKTRTALDLREVLAIVPDGPPPTSSKHARRHRRSKEVDAEIASSYLGGDTVNLLAARYGVDRRTISAVVSRAGGSLRYRLIGEDELALATVLYASGESLASIGSNLGVAANTVRTALLAAGVTMRDTHGHRRR